LQQLDIVDPLNTADAQTCTYSYDDLQRIMTDNCVSGSTAVWNQTFSYDPFGNVNKNGNPGSSWTQGYDHATNRYLLSGGITYDANGRLTNDTFDTVLGWDIEGNLITQSSTNIAYDGLNRAAGSLTGGTWTNYFFAPDGRLMGTVNNWGAINKMFIPLPMSTAVYSGGSLQQYRRNDWQGSVRVASTPSKTLFSDTAYGAFGESYGASGSPNKQFASLTSDISSGTEQVSLSRRYHPTQGRWISPDSIIPDVFNPQSLNSYAYVGNGPVIAIDPGGHGGSFPPDLIDSSGGALGFPLDASASRFSIFGSTVSIRLVERQSVRHDQGLRFFAHSAIAAPRSPQAANGKYGSTDQIPTHSATPVFSVRQLPVIGWTSERTAQFCLHKGVGCLPVLTVWCRRSSRLLVS
jgi:RHS repeat-associated protein